MANFDGMAFPDDPDDDIGFVPPLPPEDRLWRHPSERASARPGIHSRHRRGPARTLSLMVAAAAMVAVVVGVSTVLGEDRPGRSAALADSDQLVAAPPELLDSLGPALVHVTAERPDGRTSATGVVVRDDGHLVTAAEPLIGATSITVRVADGSSFNATVVGTDRTDDLAVLDIPVRDAAVARLDTSTRPGPGERVYVVGRLVDSPHPWVGGASIDAPRERVVASDGSVLLDMLRTVLTTPGTPTAAVVCRSDGTVVGIVSSKSRRPAAPARSAPTSSMATPRRVTTWATPSPWIVRVADDIIDTGALHRGWIGVVADDRDGEGVIVRSVVAGGPAARAGLAADDRIVSIDDATVSTADDVVLAIRARRAGEQVSIVTVRDDETRRAAVTVGDQLSGQISGQR